jgi:phosphoglycerate kinase
MMEWLTDFLIKSAITIVGGADSVATINKAGLGDKVSHISTGGSGLPGVAALLIIMVD